MRSQDERKAEKSTSPVQVQNLREINENMTILLGVASSQEGDIKAIKEDVSSIKERLGGLEERFDGLEKSSNEHTALLTEHTALLTQILARLPEKS